jgi:peptidoglycan/LPS O-acetylase OafA/YrhL
MANFPWLPPLSECIAIAILICATSLNSTNPLARPFSFASLAWLGTVSYSAYIWQQFFIGGTWPSGAYLLLAGCFFPICVLLSYYCVERPCVRFAHRITSQRRVDSPTHAAIYG